MSISVNTEEKTKEEMIDSRVTAFLSAMCNWEISNHQNATMLLSLSKDKTVSDEEYYKTRDSLSTMHKSAYIDIFNEYCISAALQLKNTQPVYSHPPIYDPTNEIIEEIKVLNKNTAEVITQQQSGNEWKNKYVVVQQKGKWLIKEKLLWISNTSEWLSSAL